ncbi:MAG: glycoside hydrolase family 31 protein [Chitinophagales bacterium]
METLDTLIYRPDTAYKFTQEGHIFYVQSQNGVVLKIEVLDAKIIRFRYAPFGVFAEDFSYAIDEKFKSKNLNIEHKEKDDHYRITTDRLICLVYKEGMRVKMLNWSGTVLCEDEKGYYWQTDAHNGISQVGVDKYIQSGEYFYGLGDKTISANLRNHKLEMWGSDVYGFEKGTDPLYKNIPFYYGLHNKIAYGIFLDNSFRTFFDFGVDKQNIAAFKASGGELNYYFIYGHLLTEVAEQYAMLTGTPELPPLWALGYHQSKWSYYPESTVREIAATFRNLQIPCDVIHIDIDYMDGFRCFTWDSDKFPNPTQMISDLRAQGIKTVVIIDPGIKIDENYWVFRQALEKGYFCKRADGEYMKGKVWPGDCYFPDFTNPEVRTWWAGLFEGLIAQNGVAGVWNDMNEPAVMEVPNKTFPDDVRHDYDGHPCSHLKGHNVYGMQMARATYEGLKKAAPETRPLVITRSGYAGMQRYSSAWTGDNKATWEHLWLCNVQCQRSSISGLSFIGTDIGGFIGEPTPELYARWIQLAVFHPFCRTHSSGDHGNQEPWSFGEEVTNIARKYINLRYHLLPYLYTTFLQYVTKGSPMLRPLAFIAQKDHESHHRMAEFALGDHLLICPIVTEGANGRWLYLPAGTWYSFWSDEAFHGGTEIWADAPLDTIPLFVNEGAVIPYYPLQQYVGEKTIDDLVLHVYRTKNENEIKSCLYEDAGDGYAYTQGEYNQVLFMTAGDDKTMEIVQKRTGNFTPTYKHYTIVIHAPQEKIASVQVNGKNVSAKSYTFEGRKLPSVHVPIDVEKLVVSFG